MEFAVSSIVLVGHLGKARRPTDGCELCCDHLKEIANARACRPTDNMLYAQNPSRPLVDKLTGRAMGRRGGGVLQ
jgi:hypothetical protein